MLRRATELLTATLLLLALTQPVCAESEKYEKVKTPYGGIVGRLVKDHWDYDRAGGEQNLLTELEISIDSGGKIVGARVVRPSDNAAFDAAAVRAAEETAAVPPPLSKRPVILYVQFFSPQIVVTGERSPVRMMSVYSSIVTMLIENNLHGGEFANADNLTAMLALDIDAQGKLTGVQLVESSGCEEFDAEAVRAAQGAKLVSRPAQAQAIRMHVYIHPRRL